MAGSFTTYLGVNTLDHVFGLQAMPTGDWANLYIALSTGTPNETGGNFLEPVASSGYIRKEIANDKTTWTNATTGDPSSIHNDIAIEFAIASGGWDTVTHFGIYDSGTIGAGHLLVWSDLDTPKPITINDTASFAANELVITLD